MITTYILKNKNIIEFDDTTNQWTLKSGATLLSAKPSLTPALVASRAATSTINPNGTATLNVDVSFPSISTLASFVQGGSTNGKSWLDRNCLSKPTSTTANENTSATSQSETKDESKKSLNKTEKVKLYKDVITFCKDFGFKPDPRLMNNIIHDNDPVSLLLNSMELIGADKELLENAESEMNSPEFTEIKERLARVECKKVVNHRLEIFYGSAGTGKTTEAISQYPNATIISGSASADPDELFYTFDPATKAYIPTSITEAMINGEPIIIDEGNLYPQCIWSRLQAVLDGKSTITDKKNVIVIKDGFKIIVTMNLEVLGNKYPLPEPIVSRAAVIKNFDKVKFDKLVENVWCD